MHCASGCWRCTPATSKCSIRRNTFRHGTKCKYVAKQLSEQSVRGMPDHQIPVEWPLAVLQQSWPVFNLHVQFNPAPKLKA